MFHCNSIDCAAKLRIDVLIVCRLIFVHHIRCPFILLCLMPILTSFIVYSILHLTFTYVIQSLWLRTGFERSIVGYNTVNVSFTYIIYCVTDSSHFITSPNLIRMIRSRRIRWAGNVACIGERCSYRDSVGKPEGRRQRRTPTHRWEDNIKMHLREVG
jgi:hypothetical protein